MDIFISSMIDILDLHLYLSMQIYRLFIQGDDHLLG